MAGAAKHLLLVVVLALLVITGVAGQQQATGDAQCHAPRTFASGFGIGLQSMMLMASLLLAGFSLGCVGYALMMHAKTAKLLAELRPAIAALEDNATAPATADRLSSILMKLDLAAEATSAAAEAITDVMIADTHSRSGDQSKTGGKDVHAGTKRHWVAAKPDKPSTPTLAAAGGGGGSAAGAAPAAGGVGDLISLDAGGSSTDDTIKMFDQDRDMKRHHDDQGSTDDHTPLPFTPVNSFNDEARNKGAAGSTPDVGVPTAGASAAGSSSSAPGGLSSPDVTLTPPLAAAAPTPDTPIMISPDSAKDQISDGHPGTAAAAATGHDLGGLAAAAAGGAHKNTLAALSDKWKASGAKAGGSHESLTSSTAAAAATRTPYNTPAAAPPKSLSELDPLMRDNRDPLAAAATTAAAAGSASDL